MSAVCCFGPAAGHFLLLANLLADESWHKVQARSWRPSQAIELNIAWEVSIKKLESPEFRPGGLR
jgi:hypothetical protein